MIPQFEGQTMLESSAYTSLLILIVSVVLKGLIYLARIYIRRHRLKF